MTVLPARRTLSIAGCLLMLSRAAFSAAVFLALIATTWQYFPRGPFALLPLFRIPVGNHWYPVGAFILLLPLVVASWLPARLLERPRRPWRWGLPASTLSVVGLGACILLRLTGDSDPQHVAYTALAVAFLWGIYLFTLQDWPVGWAVGTVALVTCLQGVVGTLQFLRQGAVGVRLLGEPALSPTMARACVIESGGQRWMRAYGLTPHPDVLGGYLAMGLLLCLGAAMVARGWRRVALSLVLVPGGLGLFFSFSRSAWLGTLAGVVYLLVTTRSWRHFGKWPPRTIRRLLGGLLLLAAIAVVLLALYGDLLVTRLFRLDNALEKGSLLDRAVGIQQAWEVMSRDPLLGVGPGRYLDVFTVDGGSARTPGFRMVHVAALVAAAELGLVGAGLWVWFVLAPPVVVARQSRRSAVSAGWAGLGAVSVALVVISLFQFYPYLLQTWWPTVFPAVVSGLVARGEDPGTAARPVNPTPGA